MYRLKRARKQVKKTPMDTFTCGEGMLKKKLAGMSPQDLVVKLDDVSGMNHLKERYIYRQLYYSIYLIIIYIYNLLVWAGIGMVSSNIISATCRSSRAVWRAFIINGKCLTI